MAPMNSSLFVTSAIGHFIGHRPDFGTPGSSRSKVGTRATGL